MTPDEQFDRAFTQIVAVLSKIDEPAIIANVLCNVVGRFITQYSTDRPHTLAQFTAGVQTMIDAQPTVNVDGQTHPTH
jgi:hypothetical protein